ncbi:MAG: hypothetical protein KGM42_18490 [Hyphomicrobiales bacterium]|nr:hypothetical protein [Hyphomicrobiales bacterium]
MLLIMRALAGQERMRRYRVLGVYFLVAVLLSAAYRFAGWTETDIVRALAATQLSVKAHALEASVVFAIGSALLTYFSFPAMPVVYIAAGYCLDAYIGAAALLIGSATGALGAFLLYRAHVPTRFCHHGEELGGAKMWLTLAGLRLSPIVPAPLVNFFAVFVRAGPVMFLVTTIVGSAPLVLFYEIVGQQGRSLLFGGQANWRELSVYGLLLVVSTALSYLGPWRSFLRSLRNIKNEMATALRSRGALNDRMKPMAGE